MIDNLLPGLTLLSALGCGLAAGVFFAFSSFVLPALSRLPPAQAIAAMQSINMTAVTPVFMLELFGTAAACVILVIAGSMSWVRPGTGYVVAGSLVYLAGTILVTAIFNVPRNNVLASLDPSGIDGPAAWEQFRWGWTVWNHIRSASGLSAAALLTLGYTRLHY